MRLHSTIAVAALVVSLAAPGVASAKARVRDAAPSALDELRQAEDQIAQLRAEVNELKARMSQPVASQADVQAVSAKADQALAAAAAANTTAIAAKAKAEKPGVPEAVKWAAATQISGRMYFNASNISQKANGVPTAANGTGFNIKRMYLGVDHKFDDTFSMNVTTDISNVIGQTSNGNFAAPSVTVPACAATPCPATAVNVSNAALVGRGFYVKKAYVQAKINPALIVRLGAADLPWVPYVEGQYGYRHIENIMVDRLSFGTSADWGIHVLGDLPGKVISYQVSVINGGGYRNVKVTKGVDVEGRISA
ncbi:MAG: hypothetical protein JF593_11640, partial [Novosphingobium sp.]|nr:hypothetical protein [Novosphingobium sp.]